MPDWITLPFDRRDYRNPEYCGTCPLNQRTSISFVPFEIFGTNPHPKVLFVAESPFHEEMKLARPLMGKAGTLLRDLLSEFLDDYALANIVSCHPSNVRLGPQAPDQGTIDYCSTHVHAFMQEICPEKVILLGGPAIKGFLPEELRARVGEDIHRVGKMVEMQAEWVNGILYACLYHPSYIARNGGVRGKHFAEWRRHLEDILAIRPVLKEEVEKPVTKFSIHPMDQLALILQELEPHADVGLDYEALDLDPWKVSNRVTGFSLSVIHPQKRGRSYFIQVDREPTERERELLLEFFGKKTLWTYNAKYEMNTTWAWLGKRVHFNDAFALCKIDCSPISLKNNAKKYLDAELWEEEVYSIVELFTVVFEQMEKLHTTFEAQIACLHNSDYEQFLTSLQELDEKKAKKFKKLAEALQMLSEKVTLENLQWGLQQFPFAWGAVPRSILGEYCSWDSFLTVKLKEYFWEKYESFYPYYRSQTWLAATMEAYGYNWDDQRAEELYQYYVDEATSCLFKLIKAIDLTDLQIMDAEQIYLDTVLTRQDKLLKLKEIFNPLSNDPKAQAPFWRAYRTPQVETWVFFTYLEHEILQHEDLDDLRFIKAIDKTSFETTVQNLYTIAGVNAQEVSAVTGILKRADFRINQYFQRFAIEITDVQYEAHTKYGGVHVDCENGGFPPGTKEGDKEYKYYEPWNPQFFMLYQLKRFKKIMKSESTYIRGRIGRDQVSLSTYEGLTHPPRRREAYFNCDTPQALDGSSRWILNATYFENGASTKRWRAGIHTVPASSELREIYTPRSATAVMFHIDYAQNEVRFLAAMAHEKNLLAAFDSGIDIHRYVASKIFKKDPSEVTGEQRRWAKAGTFGLLYGKTVVSFAQEMMGGDLEGAQRFFHDFFEAFPGIQIYIAACHKQVKRYGFVETMFGDPIYIDQERYREDEVLRRSQNYPIQSSASSLGAHAVSLLNESVIKRGLQAIPLGFCHDAADWEVETSSLLPFIALTHHFMVAHIQKYYNVPVGVDWGIGIHQNFTMELVRKDNDLYHFSCPALTFDKIIARLQTYFRVDYTIEKKDSRYKSLSELFVNKGAFSKYLGEHIMTYEGLLKLST